MTLDLTWRRLDDWLFHYHNIYHLGVAWHVSSNIPTEHHL